ncbi:hypothetical protein OHC33_011182 [Knufia fluminis]|uniref:Fumarylacetoacetase n=1 Tax=Knufia fluminis TaxID=191047 RepID=A0AAN8EDB9_9EURO|nr:hypothetical protein OHC33_011182 [Knufia fluminis]
MGAASWLDVEPDSPYSIENIPFGIISKSSSSLTPTPAVAIGEYCISLKRLAEGNAFVEPPDIQPHLEVFTHAKTLNAFAGLGRPLHQSVRLYIRELFLDDTKYPHLLKDNAKLQNVTIHRLVDCTTHVPMQIGDYTDFYAGLNHAYNIGVLFRGPQNALPHGQILPQPGDAEPVHAPSRKLDIELELAAFLCKGNGSNGEPIAIAEAENYIFGYTLMNDWSARDIQAFEYVPLGPFGSKNFATTISSFVVLADALEPFRCNTMLPTSSHDALTKCKSVLPYLQEDAGKKSHYNIRLHVDLKPADQGHANQQGNGS